MPETDPRKLLSSRLSRLKQGSNGRPLSEAHTLWPRTCSVLPGRRTRRIGPEPENWIEPVAPMSSRTRPAPRVPSKQVKANTLPATNLRASSAFIMPANAGTTIAPAVTAPNTKRASMQLLQLTSAGSRSLFEHDPRENAFHACARETGPPDHAASLFTRCLPYQPWQHWSSLV